MKFVAGKNGRNPERNPPRPRFFHHENHMESPRRELGTPGVGGECLTACAMKLPLLVKNYIKGKAISFRGHFGNVDAMVHIFLAIDIKKSKCYSPNVSPRDVLVFILTETEWAPGPV